jgi:hypothetical protein
MYFQSQPCNNGYVNSANDIPSPLASLFLTLQLQSAGNSLSSLQVI